MRDIKFRAWDINWQSGGGRMLPWESIKDRFAIVLSRTSYHIVMQYTGLKDKNGKEIYESDICKYYDEQPADQKLWEATTPNSLYTGDWVDKELIGQIEWNAITAGFTVGGTKWFDEKIEVIGNIYENPELLKGKI